MAPIYDMPTTLGYYSTAGIFFFSTPIAGSGANGQLALASHLYAGQVSFSLCDLAPCHQCCCSSCSLRTWLLSLYLLDQREKRERERAREKSVDTHKKKKKRRIRIGNVLR